MSERYILDGKKAVPCDDLFEWGKEMQKQNRRVAKDNIGDIEVSTVFLGLNHNFGDGDPLLFETMVFGGKLDGGMDRYSTWEEAVIGHKAMLKRVKNK